MLGWKFFTFTWAMLSRNFREMLQFGLIIAAIFFVLQQVFQATFPEFFAFDGTNSGTPPELQPMDIFAIVTFFLVNLLATAVIAIAWHRYVLLQEDPASWIPPLNVALVWRYFLTTLKLFLVIFALGLAVGLAASFIFGLLVAFQVNPLFLQILTLALILVFFVLILTVTLRLSLAFPAVAVGQPLSFTEAWDRTKDDIWPIVVLASLNAVLLGGFQLIILLIGPNLGPLFFILGFIIYFGSTMYGISMLTTLYGYYIEGREL